jgi:hypothetical protein
MSDSNILSTSDAFTSTHRLAVEVLIAAWTIQPEGEDVDDIADLLGVHLERAAYEEIASGLAEAACVPHDQMRDQLPVAGQQELRRRAFPGYCWATTTEIHPVRYRSSLHMEAHLLDAHLEQVLQRLPLAQLEDFHAEAHRHWQGRPAATAPRPPCPPPIRRCMCWSWRPSTTGRRRSTGPTRTPARPWRASSSRHGSRCWPMSPSHRPRRGDRALLLTRP